MTNDNSWHYLSFQDKRFLEFLVTYTLNEQSAKLVKHFSELNGRSAGIKDNVRIDFNVGGGRGHISFHSAHGMGPPGIFAALAPGSCWMCIVLPIYEKDVDFIPRFSILKLKTRHENESPQTAVIVGAPEIHQGTSFIVWELHLASAI
ncbi:hypothetical protein BDZ89DRAFT_1130876 [Hymenopellis radicata]|nr:hypothetical protein BDZ89DRAFT_1130876 [Hymenopellis radicata]